MPIVVDTAFGDTGDKLARGAPTGYTADFINAPVPGTYYPAALANALAGRDLDPGQSDIRIVFDGQASWSFATDGEPQAGQVDFVSVALHELGHGLG